MIFREESVLQNILNELKFFFGSISVPTVFIFTRILIYKYRFLLLVLFASIHNLQNFYFLKTLIFFLCHKKTLKITEQPLPYTVCLDTTIATIKK